MSMPRLVKIPSDDHPISIERFAGRVIVSVAGKVIADTADAVVMHEASLPPVYYLPRGDVDEAEIQRSELSTYCPFKGDASYFSIPAGGDLSRDAIWSYESPYPAVSEISCRLAFYPDRVDEIRLVPD